MTRRMLDLVDPTPGIRALDAGCGCGVTLGMLREQGAMAFGLDLNQGFLRDAVGKRQAVALGDLAFQPFADGSMDLVVCECAWNLTDKGKVLAEFFRVLRPGGMLVLADIYARGVASGQWPVRCCFAQATDLPTVLEEVSTAGFEIGVVEEHTELLKKTAADFVFRHGSLHGFWQAVTGSSELADMACDASRASKPGLFLLTARAVKR